MSTPVFLIGAQRSGTTWLQCLLGAHPAIATPQEPEFFTGYVAHWDRKWRGELRHIHDDTSVSRLKGVSSVMTAAEFAGMVRTAIDAFHRGVLALKPGASVVLEKCPEYHRVVGVIRTYVPEARFIHLVRDGRDVAASLLAASRGWGRRWAPRRLSEAAAMWAAAVRNARAAREGSPYLELRYEDLLADTPAWLEKAIAFCGLSAEPGWCERTAERFAVAAMRADPRLAYEAIVVGGEVAARLGERLAFPEGFFREGKVGGWRTTWGPAERYAFDRAAGDLLVELGYEPDRRWVQAGRADVLRAALRRAVTRGRTKRW